MKAFMTTGTFDFLKKMDTKYPAITFHFMSGGANTLAYYEDKSKNLFSSGRAYDVILTDGAIAEDGYVVMNNIPVSDEGKPVFEHRFKQRQGDMASVPGFQAFRLLRPTKGNTYVVFTQWASKQDFDAWKNSEQFQKSHKDQAAAKPPAYYADKPFVTTYSMIDKDEM